ncbi:hypothetical protein NA57DRAFT_70625 [Rhizodiscina lignyota]|uniref:Uncharacterized protein n=1 Tax=Rhizodiscina lignyota TaxID=1504668 RepID=A0A9P4IQW1_9PEZI|nr:hypothetical protein NA57DRAFT_70625 [Rhizodiscina lignyota]
MSMGTDTRLVSFYTPKIKLEVALHRRGNLWYIVYSRAYGMAEGWKLFAALNDPEQADVSTASTERNTRFWLQEKLGPCPILLEDLLAATPPIIKDLGIKRKAKTKPKESQDVDVIEESLIEVLLKEEELCHRCAYCGAWEYSYDHSTRHRRVTEPGTSALYWCGDCTQLRSIVNRNSWWWRNPQRLGDYPYFYYKLP